MTETQDWHTYDYEVGSAVEAMDNVEQMLHNNAPTGMGVRPFTMHRRSVSGMEYGDGFSKTEWKFAYLSTDDMNTLMGYVGTGNQSAIVYIRTKDQDGTYGVYKAVMHRPKQGEDMTWDLQGWRDITIHFTHMESWPDPEE